MLKCVHLCACSNEKVKQKIVRLGTWWELAPSWSSDALSQERFFFTRSTIDLRQKRGVARVACFICFHRSLATSGKCLLRLVSSNDLDPVVVLCCPHIGAKGDPISTHSPLLSSLSVLHLILTGSRINAMFRIFPSVSFFWNLTPSFSNRSQAF